MKNCALLSVALVLLMSGVAQAGFVNVSILAYPLYDGSGNNLTTNTKTLAVVDKDGDGLAGFHLSSIAPGTSLATAFDPSDWIITGSPDGGASTMWNEETGSVGLPDMLYSRTYVFELTGGLATGQHLYLFWFPGLSASDTTVAAGQKFGVLDLASLDTQNGMGVLPPDNGGASSFAIQDLSSSVASAQYSVTPEPATMLLLAAGGVLALVRRRRTA
jgi:hypothetical protein